MAKAASLKIKLLSTADTGYFYVTKKNARTKTEKFKFTKYDPVVQARRVQGGQDQVSAFAALAVVATGRLRAPFFVGPLANAGRRASRPKSGPFYSGASSGWSAGSAPLSPL